MPDRTQSPPARVWTTGARWRGNLLPALVWLPLTALGAFLLSTGRIAMFPGILILTAGQIGGWLALNAWGMAGNRAMRNTLTRRYAKNLPAEPTDCWFVGAATPSYVGLLDPHQDVGFLVIEPDRLRFLGDSMAIDLERERVTQIRLRSNVHSVLGLGRWVSVEGQLDGKPIRLLIEPRTRRTLLANKADSKRLIARLRAWQKDASPGTKPGARGSSPLGEITEAASELPEGPGSPEREPKYPPAEGSELA